MHKKKTTKSKVGKSLRDLPAKPKTARGVTAGAGGGSTGHIEWTYTKQKAEG